MAFFVLRGRYSPLPQKHGLVQIPSPCNFKAKPLPQNIHAATWILFLGQPNLLTLFLNQSPCLSNIERTPSLGGPLHATAFTGNLQILQILLSALEDPNGYGGCDGTPLKVVSWRGDPEIVLLLLQSGAEVNAKFEGKTTLIVASEVGSAKVVKLLLDSGVGINAWRPF